MTPARETPAAKMDEVMRIANETATAVLGAKLDIHHLSKTVDRLVDLSEQTVQLHGKMASYGDRLDRAFNDISSLDSKIAKALDKLTETLDKDRTSSTDIADTVKGYRASLRTLYVVGSVIVGLLIAQARMTVTAVRGDIADVQAMATRNANTIEVLDAKSERLRIEDKLVAGEHHQRLMRLERQGDEVAP